MVPGDDIDPLFSTAGCVRNLHKPTSCRFVLFWVTTIGDIASYQDRVDVSVFFPLCANILQHCVPKHQFRVAIASALRIFEVNI